MFAQKTKVQIERHLAFAWVAGAGVAPVAGSWERATSLEFVTSSINETVL